MAKLNGLYIFVVDEEMSYGVEVTEHPVETGIEISDHVKRKGATLSLTGEIVGENAASVLSKIKQMHQNGTLCKYAGRTTLANCLITDFSTGHPNTVWGGCEFSMTLKEIRTASTSYKKTKNDTNKSGTQQTKKNSDDPNVYHTVKPGDTIWDLVAGPNAPYKQYSLGCDGVMQLNQGAFSRKGDFRTLQIGEKIIVGTRTKKKAATTDTVTRYNAIR
jgi:hypothetical protein